MNDGPYLNMESTEAYMPRSSWEWNAAQREARYLADENQADKAVYDGIHKIQIHDHDEAWDMDDCPEVECYMFSLVER